MKILWIYLIAINLVTFIIRGVDKRTAAHNGRLFEKAEEEGRRGKVVTKSRISERTLLILSVLGGRLGAYAGMILFRHKTIKGSFLWKFWGIVLVWILILIYTLSK